MDLFQEIRGGQPDFDSVFGQNQSSLQKPQPQLGGMGEILQPIAVSPLAAQQMTSQPEVKGLTSDVESSLVRAAENLSEWRASFCPLHTPYSFDLIPKPFPPLCLWNKAEQFFMCRSLLTMIVFSSITHSCGAQCKQDGLD